MMMMLMTMMMIDMMMRMMYDCDDVADGYQNEE